MSAEVLARISVLYKTPIEYFLFNKEESGELNINPQILMMLAEFSRKEQEALYNVLQSIMNFLTVKTK